MIEISEACRVARRIAGEDLYQDVCHVARDVHVTYLGRRSSTGPRSGEISTTRQLLPPGTLVQPSTEKRVQSFSLARRLARFRQRRRNERHGVRSVSLSLSMPDITRPFSQSRTSIEWHRVPPAAFWRPASSATWPAATARAKRLVCEYANQSRYGHTVMSSSRQRSGSQHCGRAAEKDLQHRTYLIVQHNQVPIANIEPAEMVTPAIIRVHSKIHHRQ